jgi:hypothetical protein
LALLAKMAAMEQMAATALTLSGFGLACTTVAECMESATLLSTTALLGTA